MINLLVSLVTVVVSLGFRAQSQGVAPLVAQWPVALNILAGSLLGSYFSPSSCEVRTSGSTRLRMATSGSNQRSTYSPRGLQARGELARVERRISPTR